MTAVDLLALYQALRDASRRQLDALTADDMTAFNAAMDEREALFAEIREHDGQLATLPAERAARVREAIDAILATDAQLGELASRAATTAQEELGHVQQGLTALHSYAAEDTSTAYFIDRNH